MDTEGLLEHHEHTLSCSPKNHMHSEALCWEPKLQTGWSYNMEAITIKLADDDALSWDIVHFEQGCTRSNHCPNKLNFLLTSDVSDCNEGAT